MPLLGHHGEQHEAGLDNRHRNKDDEISHKHGNTLIRMLRKYGQSFAAGYPETEKLSELLLQLNEASLSQLRRDHETRHRSTRSHVRSGSRLCENSDGQLPCRT